MTTVGSVVSTTQAAFVASAPTAPAVTAGKVSVAALPAASARPPPLSSSAVVAAWFKSSEVSPACTV